MCEHNDGWVHFCALLQLRQWQINIWLYINVSAMQWQRITALDINFRDIEKIHASIFRSQKRSLLSIIHAQLQNVEANYCFFILIRDADQ